MLLNQAYTKFYTLFKIENIGINKKLSAVSGM